MNPEEHLRRLIRDVPDFPSPGIAFKDLTPLIGDPVGFSHAIDLLAMRLLPHRADKVVAIEARGFIFGGALAYRLNAGFTIIRKPGKLPFHTHRESYELEYGTDSMEIHVDAIRPGEKVLLFDDLLATGGTMLAATKLVSRQGAKIVQLAFLVELTALQGREKLAGLPVFSLLQF